MPFCVLPAIFYDGYLTGDFQPGGLIAKTEQLMLSRIFSAVLPIKNPCIPVRPTEPMTTRSMRALLTRTWNDIGWLTLDEMG